MSNKIALNTCMIAFQVGEDSLKMCTFSGHFYNDFLSSKLIHKHHKKGLGSITE